MRRTVDHRALWIAAAVLAGVLAAGAAMDRYLARVEIEEHRGTAEDLARGSAFAIEQEFSRSLAAAATLGALVSEGASDREVQGVAERLLVLSGGTACLQLAPGFVISRSWPLRGNEAAIGLDLLRSPIHGANTQRLLEDHRPLLYGPFQLVQGGVGFALRVPVRVLEAGKERPWGLASAIIRLEALLDGSRIPRLLEAGYAYEITRTGAGEGRPELLASSSPEGKGPTLEAPVSVAVDLPGQRWMLRVAPVGGWRPLTSPTPLRVAVLLIAVLLAALAYRIVSLPALLRREVAARTKDLEAAHLEQRRAEQAQRRSQKLEAIGLLAGGVAHDFNNLLVGILGYADLLAAEATPGSLGEEAARTIAQAAQRAAELTRQLLSFARLGGQLQVDVDLHVVTREVAALLSRTIGKSIEVVLRLDAPRPHVRGDPGQLQQVILNLAVNARDAMPEGGTLRLETTNETLDELSEGRGLPPGSYLVISVSDTGVGISKENIERIFEPFFTTKEDGRGTGLGLATVYGIAKSHGGTVRVYSEEGAGSRFMVYLPAQEAPAVSPAAPAAPAPRGAGVVLVVDDEEIVRRTAGRMLTSLGYQVEQVSGGGEAIEWLASRPVPPAAVLLDMAMPGLDGRACFRQMRARHPGLRVVLSSGFARNGRAQELIDEGAVAFVLKPYRTDALARALAEAIKV